MRRERLSRSTPCGGYSDYIVYVDESGDHSLTSIDPDYPVFVLSFCIFRKEEYACGVTPIIRQLKFATFGHDIVVLHEADIRRKRGVFSRLSKEPREAFLNALTDIIGAANFQLVAVVIDKRKLKDGCDSHGSSESRRAPVFSGARRRPRSRNPFIRHGNSVCVSWQCRVERRHQATRPCRGR